MLLQLEERATPRRGGAVTSLRLKQAGGRAFADTADSGRRAPRTSGSCSNVRLVPEWPPAVTTWPFLP